MTGPELRCGLCRAGGTIEWMGMTEEGEAMFRNTATGAAYAFGSSVMHAQEWDTVEAIVLGRRNAHVMRQFTRIVGYFSEVSNWNRSKIAELHDRHKGIYALPEGVHA